MLANVMRMLRSHFSLKHPWKQKGWRAILPFVAITVIVLSISQLFGLIGGIDEYLLAFRYELLYVLLAFAAFFYLMRPGLLRFFVAASPIVVIYLGMDLYYLFMHRIAKLDDLLLLPEGLIVSPIWVQIGLWLALLLWTITFITQIRRKTKELLLPLALTCLAFLPFCLAVTAPTQILAAAASRGVNIVPWSDRWTVALMGRLSSIVLFAASKKKAINELAVLPIVDDPERDSALLKNALKTPRNIHIIVLESFLDPERFSGLKFKTPPAPPEFAELRKNQHVATSPVFGGGTAQAEFEILCGVPALELYTSAEFNMLDGSKTPCLPNMLAEAGYRTIATQSYQPDFFNSERAYQSLGFQEINYPTVFAGQRKTYLQYDDAESYIFDGDVYQQNLTYIEKALKEGKPILNYVLGVYGHLPHDTDFNRFPPKVDIEGVDKNSQTDLAINQFYYRAAALADYLKKLRALDPAGLILVTSDHLPPLDGGPLVYKKLGYTLIANEEYKQNIWFYFGPEHKKIAWPNAYYKYMDFLLDMLTEERICHEIVCKNRETWSPEKLIASYNNIMSQGAGIMRSSTSSLVAGGVEPSPVRSQANPSESGTVQVQ